MRRIAHALASLRWRLTLTFVGLLALLLVLLAGYQYFTLRASLISNRVGEMQADFTSARRLLVTEESALGATITGRRLCATQPDLVAKGVARAVSVVTGQTVDVVVYNRALTELAVAPSGSSPPLLDQSVLQRVASTGIRSGPQQLETASGDQLVVAFPVLNASGACGVAQLSVAMSPIDGVLHDELLLITLGGVVMLVLALIIGVLLTGRTLRPMRRLTATAEQLAAGDLTARS